MRNAPAPATCLCAGHYWERKAGVRRRQAPKRHPALERRGGRGYRYQSTIAAARGENNATYASYANIAKTPDTIIAGTVTVDANNLVTSAAVQWPDGKPGTLTITSRDANNAVLAYNVTYGSPVIKTFTQPTITGNAAGAATNVPQILVS
ncbi:hypothetical protein [Arthrobacter sp. B1I2]|uniref:hypothetical protein n=1 Tax=Arthrobacter sp. B1I2 TaxID=3042263 RepID=UPI002781904A|nr:hypothetical protein [Arthrobacter sp. B1I2]MDQ0731142.1 hypothetical protein [Arthrobacter sp. B1I2]